MGALEGRVRHTVCGGARAANTVGRVRDGARAGLSRLMHTSRELRSHAAALRCAPTRPAIGDAIHCRKYNSLVFFRI